MEAFVHCVSLQPLILRQNCHCLYLQQQQLEQPLFVVAVVVPRGMFQDPIIRYLIHRRRHHYLLRRNKPLLSNEMQCYHHPTSNVGAHFLLISSHRRQSAPPISLESMLLLLLIIYIASNFKMKLNFRGTPTIIKSKPWGRQGL